MFLHRLQKTEYCNSYSGSGHSPQRQMCKVEEGDPRRQKLNQLEALNNHKGDLNVTKSAGRCLQWSHLAPQPSCIWLDFNFLSSYKLETIRKLPGFNPQAQRCPWSMCHVRLAGVGPVHPRRRSSLPVSPVGCRCQGEWRCRGLGCGFGGSELEMPCARPGALDHRDHVGHGDGSADSK